MWMKTAASIARIAVGTAAGLPLLLYLLQDRLLFFPMRLDPEDARRVRENNPEAEEINLLGDDGTPLHGWLMRPHDTNGPSPLAIYFGGNAEEVSYLIEHRAHLGNWSLLLMNYRGYGLSGGKPGEAAFFADALRLYDVMRARPDIDSTRIAVLGRSLGSGVAVYLASQRSVNRVVLITPFDSVTNVGQRHYPYVPVRWLIKHPFDSLSRAGAVREPLLVLAAEEDEVIPVPHAERLYNAWTGPKQWRQLLGTDHISISDHPDYWPLISEFLDIAP